MNAVQTYRSPKAHVVFMYFSHDIQRWVVGNDAAIQKSTVGTEIRGSSPTGTGSSPH